MKKWPRGGPLLALAIFAGCLDARPEQAGDAADAADAPAVTPQLPREPLTSGPAGVPDADSTRAGHAAAVDWSAARPRSVTDPHGQRIAVDPRMRHVVVAGRGPDGQLVTRCVSQLREPLRALDDLAVETDPRVKSATQQTLDDGQSSPRPGDGAAPRPAPRPAQRPAEAR